MTQDDGTRSRLIDLTKPLDAALEIYTDGDYSDPPLVVEDWCSVADQGFRVSRLALGTQTGTHVDAPAHFVDGGATLETLDPATLIGPYFAVRPRDWEKAECLAAALDRFSGERILFLLADADPIPLPQPALDAFLDLPCPVWATSSEVEIPGAPPLHFHMALAEAGVFLIEDLDPAACRDVPDRGEMIALPLRLSEVSGAPCRVVVRVAD